VIVKDNLAPYVFGAMGVGVVVAAISVQRRAKASNYEPPPPDPPVPDPSPAPNPSAKYTPEQAASALYLLVTQGKNLNWGSKAAPNANIRDAQRDMGGLTADGIYGPLTAARGGKLISKVFPMRPAKKKGKPAQSAATTIPSNTVQIVQSGTSSPTSQTFPLTPPADQPALRAEVSPQMATNSPETEPAPARTAKQAAQTLYDFATAQFRAGKAGELGSKARPSDTVAACQRDMRLIASDGIYGAQTRARGKELLGREFPTATRTAVTKIPSAAAPPAPNVAIPVTPQEAATYLFKFLALETADMGSAAKPSEIVRGAQRDMLNLKADGIYGPATAKRGKALIGKTFPTRR
jgi:hypothetical protein